MTNLRRHSLIELAQRRWTVFRPRHYWQCNIFIVYSESCIA